MGFGGWAFYRYYYYKYLPEQYEEEACYDIVNRFNKANDSTKLELAIQICYPYYDWSKEYPKTRKGYVNTRLRFHDYGEKTQFIDKACYFIAQEAKKDNGKAQYSFGMILFDPESSYWLPDTNRAVYWFNESAKSGYPKAYGEIGTAYEDGICVDINLKKAIEYFKRGAALNDPKSQFKLGCMYRDGVSVESGWHWEIKTTTDYVSDKSIVIREYWDNQRCTDVYVYREKVTDYTTLIPKDINKAKYWWKMAEAQGFSEAVKSLQQLYN